MNEFREQSKDFARDLVDRVETRVSILERNASGGAGRSHGFESFRSNLISIIALLISLAMLLSVLFKR